MLKVDSSILRQEIVDIINNEGDFGIFAFHPNSGYLFSYNDEMKFDMASTYKIPIAIHCLKLVEDSKLNLDEIITIYPKDQRPGTGLPKTLIRNDEDNKNYSVRELLYFMMQYSDNTATDKILQVCGGPKSIMKTIEEMGIKDMRVDTTVYEFFTKQIGVEHLISEEDFTIEKFNAIEKSLPKEYIENSIAEFDKLLYDTATPKAMGVLLTKLINGEVLSETFTQLLLSIMADCKTSTGRIPALLPKNLVIHRKTGTISHVANDVAIIDLAQGPFILVIFNCHIYNKTSHEKDRFVALIAKAIYDDFTNKFSNNL